jgi:hypothetical protein
MAATNNKALDIFISANLSLTHYPSLPNTVDNKLWHSQRPNKIITRGSVCVCVCVCV